METPTVQSSCLQFDSINGALRNLLDNRCEREFLRYISRYETFRSQCLATENECRRLQDKLNSAVKDISVLDKKLQLAKRMVDEEAEKRKKVTRERNILAQQLHAVRQLLLNDHYSELPESAKKELMFLESDASEYVDAESGSLTKFSDFVRESKTAATVKTVPVVACGHSENDLTDIFVLPTDGTPAENSSIVEDANLQRSSNVADNATKRCLIMSTPKRINTIRHDELMETEMSPIGKDSSRAFTPGHHNFISRTFMMPESCARCYRKIAFGRTVFKCTDCAIVIHPECQDNTLCSCKSYMTYTRTGHEMGLLSDYLSPTVPPFVPSVVIACIREIERRGMQEPRLYRMLGTSALVHRLLEDIRCNKKIPSDLMNYDTHSICRAMINFFEHLKEPLIPLKSWKTFTDPVMNDGREGCDLVLAISTLPRANRDTLAFIMLHLHNVISASDRSIEDVAVVFTSVIFGYSGRNLHNAAKVVRRLILLPNAYWSRFVTTPPVLFTTDRSPSRIDHVETFSPRSIQKKRFFDRESSL